MGIDPAHVAREGLSLALAAIDLRFRRSLRSRDAFRVEVVVGSLSGVRAVMDQRIVALPSGDLILEARATAVFLDEGGRPQRIAPDFRSALESYLVS